MWLLLWAARIGLITLSLALSVMMRVSSSVVSSNWRCVQFQISRVFVSGNEWSRRSSLFLHRAGIKRRGNWSSHKSRFYLRTKCGKVKTSRGRIVGILDMRLNVAMATDLKFFDQIEMEDITLFKLTKDIMSVQIVTPLSWWSLSIQFNCDQDIFALLFSSWNRKASSSSPFLPFFAVYDGRKIRFRA